MTGLHQQALRVLISMQVAVLEHADEDISQNKVIKAIEACNREWQKIVKELGRA